MATVGNIKAKMILETAEYMASADKVVGRGNRMGRELEQALGKASKSFSLMFGKGVVGLVGASGVSTVMKELALATADVARHGSAAAAAYAGIENGLAEIGRSIPIVGDLYQMTVNLMNVELQLQQAARERAAGMAAGLERTLALTHEQRVIQEVGLQQYLQMEDAEKRILVLELQRRDTTKALRDQYFELRDQIDKANTGGRVMFEGQMRTYAELRDLFVEREAAIRNATDAEIESIRRVEEARKKADQERTDAWKLEMMQRAMAEQEALEAAGRAGIAAELARRNAEAQAAATRAMEFSNVESLSTAIGGVKVAGMTDNSLARLVPTQEAMKNYLAQIEKNTQAHAGGAP